MKNILIIICLSFISSMFAQSQPGEVKNVAPSEHIEDSSKCGVAINDGDETSNFPGVDDDGDGGNSNAVKQ